MGHWDVNPWDNDRAADWFADFFTKTKLANQVVETLKSDPEENSDEIRAAASVVIMLGRTYIWPIDDLDAHLCLAADQLEATLPDYDDDSEFLEAIRMEVAELRSRIRDSNASADDSSPSDSAGPSKPWWKFWA